MRLLSAFTCALALSAAAARIQPVGRLTVNARDHLQLQQDIEFTTIDIDVQGFSEQCQNDFFLQNAGEFQTPYLTFLDTFSDECAVRVDADFNEPSIILNTDPCEEFVDDAEELAMLCEEVDSQSCSLVIDETVDISETNFFMRSVYTYYICVPEVCFSDEVEAALSQALDELSDGLSAGQFFEDPDLDILASTTYTAVLFCDAEGFPARFGQGFGLDLSISGTNNAPIPVGYITIASDEDGSRFLVPTTVVASPDDFTTEIYGTNAAAELNVDDGFVAAGCIAFWRTESTPAASYLQLFCPTDDQIYAYVSDAAGNPLAGEDPVPIQEFEGLGFSFSGDLQMDEFETPDPTNPNPVITTGPGPVGQPGATPPIPTLEGANAAAAMVPTAIVAAASAVVAALAL